MFEGTRVEELKKGFVENQKPLPHADHVFGTREHAGRDMEATLRTYTERLGSIAHMRQVHSDRIAYVAQPGMYPECDALYTDHRDLWLAVKTADCLPILISSPSAVAAVHAGWRGLENGILIRTLETLINEFSLTPAEIYIHIGPHISQPNYEVEESFKHTFDERFFIPSTRRNHALLDLTAVAKDQAADEGVPDMNIYTTNMCTFDNADLFHSYRRAVKNGQEDYQAQLSFVRRRKI